MTKTQTSPKIIRKVSDLEGVSSGTKIDVAARKQKGHDLDVLVFDRLICKDGLNVRVVRRCQAGIEVRNYRVCGETVTPNYTRRPVGAHEKDYGEYDGLLKEAGE